MHRLPLDQEEVRPEVLTLDQEVVRLVEREVHGVVHFLDLEVASFLDQEAVDWEVLALVPEVVDWEVAEAVLNQVLEVEPWTEACLGELNQVLMAYVVVEVDCGFGLGSMMEEICVGKHFD